MNDVIKIMVVLVVIATMQIACGQSVDADQASSPGGEEIGQCTLEFQNDFANPQRVTIEGYDGDSMEPFISRDNQYLFFNNINDQSEDTNLHYAKRVDDLTFQYLGEISNVNSEELDAVASMDDEGNFYFVSIRDYAKTLSTIFTGIFDEGNISEIDIVDGLSVKKPGHLNFDAEISFDGQTIYFVDGQFGDSNIPLVANLVIASRQGSTFERVEESTEIFQNVNTDALEYAPSLTADECEIFFTRLEQDLSSPPTIFRAVRENLNEPFGNPEVVSAITGFVEGSTLTSDGSIMYYHKQESGKFVIYMVSR